MLERDEAAGARVPAAAGSGTWIDWRDRADRPLYRVVLWPHRSLGSRGQRGVLWVATGGFSMPLVATLGTAAFWGLLPFCMVGVGILWFALRRSNRDLALREEVTLWRDEMRVERREGRGRILRWQAVPAFVRLTVHENTRPAAYLTMRGGGREIELGAFLSPEERRALRDEIEGALAAAR